MKNQREIYEVLLAGETLINAAKFTVRLKDNGDLEYAEDRIYGNVFNAVFKYVEDWQIYKEPKWYENIPDGGVLCWVKNREDRSFYANPHTIRTFSGSHYIGYELWLFAKPLTKQEIQVFIDNAPEER